MRRHLILLLLPALAGCPPGEPASDGADAGGPRPRAIRSLEVAAGDLVHTVELIGELQGADEVRVFAQVPERIRTLHVKEGDRVKAGQLVATVRGDLQADGVRQAEAGLDAASASADALADQVRRVRTLVEAGTVPRSQLDTLEAQLRAAKAQVRQLDATVSAASAQKSRTLIKSPIDGIVANLLLREGDMAAPGVPLFTVVNTRSLKASFRAPERDFLRLAQGMPVTVSPLARPEVGVTSTVSLVGPVVDRMTRTGLVEVDLPGGNPALVPGSSIRAIIEVERRAGVILVPASAIILTPDSRRTGAAMAFVVDGSAARKRDVRIGERQQDRLEIVEGLSAGDRLVVKGAHLLRDGYPVSELAPEEPGA